MIYNNWSYMYGKIKKNNSLSVCWSFAKLSDVSDLVITNSYSNTSISNLCEEIERFYSKEYHTPSRNMLWIMSGLIYGLIVIYQYQVDDIYNSSHLLYVKSNELIILKEIEKKLSSSCNRQSIKDIQNENEITETIGTEEQMIDEPDQNLIADINLITLNEVYETYNNNNNHDIIEYELEDMSSVDILGFCQYQGTPSNISIIRRDINKTSSLDDSHVLENHTVNQTFDIESYISNIPKECHLINTTQRLTIPSHSQEIQPLAFSNNGHTQNTSILPELSDAMNAIDSSMNISNCIESNVSDRNQVHNTIFTDININDINESIPLKRSAGTDDCLTVRSKKRVKKQNRYLIIDTIIKQEINFPINNAAPKCKHIYIEKLKKNIYNFKQLIKPHIEDEQNILNLIFDKPILQNIQPARPNFTPDSYQRTQPTQPTNYNNIQQSSIQNTSAAAIITNNKLNEIDVLSNECNKNILDSINLHKCTDEQNEVMLKLIHLWRNKVYPISMKELSNTNKMKAIHIFFNIIVLSGRSWNLLKIEKKENTNEIFHIGPSEKLNIHF